MSIRATGLNLKGKTAIAKYESWLPNGRTLKASVDQAEQLFDVAQELFPYGIQHMGLDPKAWEPTGRVVSVTFTYNESHDMAVQWTLERILVDGSLSETQALKTGKFDHVRLEQYPEVYTAANKIAKAIEQFANEQPQQGSLFAVEGAA
jgi:hypothetical protein